MSQNSQTHLSISFVIVSWNGRDDLKQCLASLAAQSEQGFETIVVDNDSQDGSADMIRSDFPDVRLVETGGNLGFAEGCNRGIAVATGEWVGTLNPDAVADPHCVAELRRAIREHGPDLGMVQPCIALKEPDGRANSTGVFILSNGTAIDRDFGQPLRPDDQTEEVFCVTAGAALYRRDMLEKVRLSSGYFDRTFFMYVEDVDLGWRCRLAGYSALYVPSAKVFHKFQGSSAKRKKHFVELQCRKNRVRCNLKNASWPFVRRLLPEMLGDLWICLKKGGPVFFYEFALAARDGLGQRPAVDKIVSVDRLRTESRWVLAAGSVK